MTPELRKAFRFHLRIMSHNRQGKKDPYWLKMQRDLDAREGGPAARALGAARRDVAAEVKRYPPAIRGEGGSTLGAAFAIGDRGARGPFGQWCENPPFRFVGLAHEVAKLDHTGWYSEPDGGGDLIKGAVYQIAPMNGRARYIPAIADPNNGGAAILALGEVETAGDSSEESAAEARKDAARRADQLAEYYAEAERDYREAYNLGAAARAKAAKATQAAKAWVRAGRAVRGLYAERHALGNALARGVMAQLILQAREACDALTTARKAAAKARRDCPSWKAEAWRDGYAEGQL